LIIKFIKVFKQLLHKIVEQISLEMIFYGTGHKQLSMFCI